MQAIVNFLSGFGETILKLWEFFIALFKDFFQFLELIFKLPVFLADCFTWLPPDIWLPLSILFGVVILYKILGREG